MPCKSKTGGVMNTNIPRVALVAGAFVLLFSVFSTICIAIVGTESSYILLPLMPASFLVCGTLVAFAYVSTKSWTALILLVVFFLRLVVTPLALSVDPVLSILSYSPNSNEITKAIVFIVYEAMCVSLFVYMYCRSRGNNNTDGNRRHLAVWKKGNILLKAFALFAVLLFLFVPDAREGMSFLVVSSGTGERVTAEADTFTNIMRQLVLIGQQVAFVLIAVWAKRGYERTASPLYIVVALSFALFCVGTIVGDKRALQIYTAFASVVLLVFLFPKHKRFLTGVVVSVAGFAFALMTVYKMFYAFNYDSYLEAIVSSEQVFTGLSGNLEYYCLGPTSVAAGFAAADGYTDLNIASLLFELVRSFIGLSFLVKDLPFSMPTEYFNLFVSGGSRTSGYFIPLGVEGAVCTIPLLGPILPIALLWIAMKLECIVRRTTSPYWVFFLSYVYIRLATCLVAGNLATILTTVSTVLVTTVVLYLASRVLENREAKKPSKGCSAKGITESSSDISYGRHTGLRKVSR